MTEYRVTTDLDSLPFCTIHEMSVTVIVVDNEVEVTYHLDKVKHFGVESEYDPYRPISKLDRKVELPDPPPRISFSMKPVAADDGTYMTVTKKEEEPNTTVSKYGVEWDIDANLPMYTRDFLKMQKKMADDTDPHEVLKKWSVYDLDRMHDYVGLGPEWLDSERRIELVRIENNEKDK